MNDPAEAPRGRTATLDLYERRLLGVLIEKAKTTPDAYPLSANALRTGCNQKSNRSPQLDLDEDRVETVADALREKGALTLVQGESRVERYRHRAYEWFGVDKVELAVLAELLLRGAQTVGELRGRAARMEPIKGLTELTPVLDTLVEKGLVEYLSPPGRGAIVSHRYYSSSELDRVRRDLGLGTLAAGGASAAVVSTAPVEVARPVPAPVQPAAATASAPQPSAAPATAAERSKPDFSAELLALRIELSDEIAELRQELADLKNQLGA
ncbi:DUF480 domain-containing protein [Botrimarina hoheduenensis]|uniref:DUF480 domain-containing protein n=1 Tax=Botrimarina hoheduenensis TaxID=2528000 RepID=A0A5C5W063_9BACT|nr:DUF480 domain-containing protein [Botrimarina hoheduenensis]TWT43439.1 hypothetical protein Pla111_23900 [Botrimarina hoheduenensis]